MTTSNHILAGSLIAITLKDPILVIPLSFMSHFVLDVLPHFGNTNHRLGDKKRVKKYLIVEAAGVLGIILLLSTGIYGLNLVTLAAFLAVMPDLEWAFRYIFFERLGKKPPKTITSEFHNRIQKFEKEWAVEI